MEERLRTLTLRLRWRLIAGMVSAMLAVAFTLPVLAPRGDFRARGEVIWPNSAPTSEIIWPNRALSEVIWPNSPLAGGALGQG